MKFTSDYNNNLMIRHIIRNTYPAGQQHLLLDPAHQEFPRYFSPKGGSPRRFMYWSGRPLFSRLQNPRKGQSAWPLLLPDHDIRPVCGVANCIAPAHLRELPTNTPITPHLVPIEQLNAYDPIHNLYPDLPPIHAISQTQHFGYPPLADHDAD